MKRQRKFIGILLSGLFLAYFSASFIFVAKAPDLKDRDVRIVKLQNKDENLGHGVLRSSTEHAEDALKFFSEFTLSFLEDFHTVEYQNRLEKLKNSQFGAYDIYLSIRRLQI